MVNVEFYANQNWIGSDNDGSDGWAITWGPVPIGSYSFTATAYDDMGLSGISLPVSISVRPPAPDRR